MKNQKGITLIALVITIIVLLILAGVALRMVAGNEGILTKAEKAVNETNIAGAKEQVELMIAELSADYYEKKFVDKTESGKLVDYIKNALATAKPTSNGEFSVSIDGSGNVSVTDKGGNSVVEGTLDENGKITWTESSGGGTGGGPDEVTPEEADTKYFEFAFNEDGTATLLYVKEEYAGMVIVHDEEDIKIPVVIKDGDTYIKDVVIPSKAMDENGNEYTVTQIGEGAFAGLDFTEEEVENGYVTVETNERFTSFEIPACVTSIGDYAFLGCTSLSSINIPNSVTSIGEEAFLECTSLSSINIPDSVTSIGHGAFSYCTSLSSINIPESVTSIGNCAFSYCTSLSSINIPNSVTSIGVSTFYYCTSLSSINIPQSVTSIEGGAFEECTSLSSINIPDSVTSIGNEPFEDTAWYNSQPDGVVYAGKVLYKYKGTMPSNTTITVNEGTKGIAAYAFSECKNLSSINIPESVTSIGYSAFEGCTRLSSINIPEGVTRIGDSAFEKCTRLSSINIPESVTSIEARVFYYCTSLSSINIPESVTSIGARAFEECTSLSSINIPDSVTSIGVCAFASWTEEQTINCEILEVNKPSGWDAKWDYFDYSIPRKAEINWGVSM